MASEGHPAHADFPESDAAKLRRELLEIATGSAPGTGHRTCRTCGSFHDSSPRRYYCPTCGHVQCSRVYWRTGELIIEPHGKAVINNRESRPGWPPYYMEICEGGPALEENRAP